MIYDCSSVQSCDSASRSYFHTLTFFQPPIFPKTLTNLTDLTDFTILQTPYKRAGCTGAPLFFRAPCTGCCIAAFRRGWKIVRRAAKIACFPSFLHGKVPIFRPEKISKNPLAHSAPRPDQFYGLEPCEMAGRKVGRCVAALLRPTLPNVAIGYVSRLALLVLTVSSDVQQADGVPEVLHRRGEGFHSIVKRDDD